MKKTKVLVIALPSARAHCVVEKLCQDGAEVYSYCPISHHGLSAQSKELHFGSVVNEQEITKCAKKINPDFAFIDPEVALGAGIADCLLKLGILCVGPTQSLARIETSKSFTRGLIKKYRIGGNPEYHVFIENEGVKECLEKLGEFVIKPDGLTGGKGVKISGEHLHNISEALLYCRKVLETHPVVVIEEKLKGEEFTVQAFCDGHYIICAPPVQDFKRAYENDKGPNTGSMGSYSSLNHRLPFLELEDVITAEMILLKIVGALQKETGEKYKGIIYGAFIKTKDGIKVIEINARGGDPELVNILSILQTNFLDLCLAIVKGTLSACKIFFAKKATVCKYIVPNGYPTNPQKGCPIYMSGVKPCDNLRIYYGDVARQEDGSLLMGVSRAALCVGIGDTIKEAENVAELAAIQVDGAVFHRSDIGTPELIQKSVDNMRK